MIDPPGDGNRQKDQEEARMDTMGGPTDSRTAAGNETKDATAPLDQERDVVLCTSCFDNLSRSGVLGITPQSICENCGRLCLGYRCRSVFPPLAGGFTTGADFAGSGARGTLDGRTRDPEALIANHNSAASSADPLPSEIDPLECAEIKNPTLRSAVQEVGRILLERDEAYGYLSRLFVHLAPQCTPLPDLPGLCTQIDNYIAGLHAKLAAADPALRMLSQQWRDRAVATDAFAMEPQHSEQARSNLQHLAAQMELCAADLDRLCPEIRDEPKSDPV